MILYLQLSVKKFATGITSLFATAFAHTESHLMVQTLRNANNIYNTQCSQGCENEINRENEVDESSVCKYREKFYTPGCTAALDMGRNVSYRQIKVERGKGNTCTRIYSCCFL